MNFNEVNKPWASKIPGAFFYIYFVINPLCPQYNSIKPKGGLF